jgi:hypothetical protein
MTVMQLIHRLSELPGDMEVYAKNPEGLYRRIESVETDDNYPDAMIVAGDVE